MNHFIARCHQQNKRGILSLFSVREKMKEEKKNTDDGHFTNCLNLRERVKKKRAREHKKTVFAGLILIRKHMQELLICCHAGAANLGD